jgi:Lon protease-like protein
MTSIPLFPLNTVLYPDGYLPLQIFEVRYGHDTPVHHGRAALRRGAAAGRRGSAQAGGQRETLAPVGTLARVIDWAAPLSGLLQIKCMGQQRFSMWPANS